MILLNNNKKKKASEGVKKTETFKAGGEIPMMKSPYRAIYGSVRGKGWTKDKIRKQLMESGSSRAVSFSINKVKQLFSAICVFHIIFIVCG